MWALCSGFSTSKISELFFNVLSVLSSHLFTNIQVDTLYLDAPSPIVHLPLGSLQGTEENGIISFLGVPYAQPPVGSRRFSTASSTQGWPNTRVADTMPPLCIQSGVLFGNMSEDCLYLNIWVPSSVLPQTNQHDQKLFGKAASQSSVLVWIHGGAFQIGGLTNPTYPGGELARRTGNIVVAIQYRLGPLGFLLSPAILAENGEGNFGLSDQMVALRFISKNIAYFGGDPSSVTIFGESAGGGSVSWHLATPTSWPYFSKAIMESPGPAIFRTIDQSNTFTNSLSQTIGCSQSDSAQQLACLRTQPAKAFVSHTWSPPLGAIPTLDGTTTKFSPVQVMNQGKSRPNTPVIVGSNEQEGNFFAWTAGYSLQPSWLTIQLLEYLYFAPFFDSQQTATVQGFYSKYWAQPSTYFEGGSEMVADCLIDCLTVFMSNALSLKSGSPVYRYLFTHHPKDWIFGFLNATHTAEVAYVFGEGTFMGMRFTPDEERLSKNMSDMWGHFSRTGQPSSSLQDWPIYQGATEAGIRVIDTIPSWTQGWKHDICQKYLPYIL